MLIVCREDNTLIQVGFYSQESDLKEASLEHLVNFDCRGSGVSVGFDTTI